MITEVNKEIVKDALKYWVKKDLKIAISNKYNKL